MYDLIKKKSFLKNSEFFQNLQKFSKFRFFFKILEIFENFQNFSKFWIFLEIYFFFIQKMFIKALEISECKSKSNKVQKIIF